MADPAAGTEAEIAPFRGLLRQGLVLESRQPQGGLQTHPESEHRSVMLIPAHFRRAEGMFDGAYSEAARDVLVVQAIRFGVTPSCSLTIPSQRPPTVTILPTDTETPAANPPLGMPKANRANCPSGA